MIMYHDFSLNVYNEVCVGKMDLCTDEDVL